jgi:hypothetical protein
VKSPTHWVEKRHSFRLNPLRGDLLAVGREGRLAALRDFDLTSRARVDRIDHSVPGRRIGYLAVFARDR